MVDTETILFLELSDFKLAFSIIFMATKWAVKT